VYAARLDQTKYYDTCYLQQGVKFLIGILLDTGCFMTCGHYCRRWFPRSLWSKKFI